MVLPRLSTRSGAEAIAESGRRVRGAERGAAEARRDAAGGRQPARGRNGAAAETQRGAAAPPRQPARRPGQQFCPLTPSRCSLFPPSFRLFIQLSVN